MHIVFRVDASITIGTGHVVRCLTLADALKKAGHTSQFICRRHDGHLGALIEQRSFRLSLLEPDTTFIASEQLTHTDWLGTGWLEDTEDCIATLHDKKADWLVVDHYALDHRWEKRMHQHVGHIMAIDDLADRCHDVDLLLDQNFYPDMAERYDGLLSATTVNLIGPRYAMLRNEFIEQRDRASIRNELKNILLYFGGVDQHGLTSRALQAIQLTQVEANITAIIGDGNPHAENIRQICESMNNTVCHRNVDNVAELMVQADLAIGAGGTTTWERCYLGLPTIVVTLADNQRAVNEAVASAGACLLAGDAGTSNHDIAKLMGDIIDDNTVLTAASEAAFAIMQDHVGTTGVVSMMEDFHV